MIIASPNLIWDPFPHYQTTIIIITLKVINRNINSKLFLGETMVKNKRNYDINQANLWDNLGVGALRNFEIELKESLNAAVRAYLAGSPTRSRHTLAGEISHLLDRTITEDMLNAYISTGKTDNHPHADLVAAICKITGAVKPLEIFAGLLSVTVVTAKDMIFVELAKVSEQIEKLTKRKEEIKRQAGSVL